MIIIWLLSIFFIIYGVLGLFGIQRVPHRLKGKEYEKKDKKKLLESA